MPLFPIPNAFDLRVLCSCKLLLRFWRWCYLSDRYSGKMASYTIPWPFSEMLLPTNNTKLQGAGCLLQNLCRRDFGSMQDLCFFDKEMGQKRICGVICFLSHEHSMIRRHSWSQDCLYFFGFLGSVKTLLLSVGWEFSEVRAEILPPNCKWDVYLLATKHIKTLFYHGKIKSKWPSGTCAELKISKLSVWRCLKLMRTWVAPRGVDFAVWLQLHILNNAFV